MKKYNLTVDATRNMLALLVIAIHTQPFFEINHFLGVFVNYYLGRLAVPLFFVLSGYYLHLKMKKSNNPNNEVKKTVFSLLRLYLLSFIIYVPIWIFQNRPINPLHFIFDALWGGMHYHLWYFVALIIGIIIVTLLNKRLKSEQTWLIVSVLYLIGTLLNAHYGLFFETMPSIYLSRNGIFFAPIFVMIGFYPNKNKNLLLTVLMLLALWFEISYLNSKNQLHDLTSMTLFLVPVVICLVPYILCSSKQTHSNEVFHRISLSMYIVHPLFVIGYVILNARNLITLTPTLLFIFVLLLSIGSSWIYQTIRLKAR